MVAKLKVTHDSKIFNVKYNYSWNGIFNHDLNTTLARPLLTTDREIEIIN